jgi:hypothetical protein
MRDKAENWLWARILKGLRRGGRPGKSTEKDGIIDIHKEINNRFRLSQNTSLIVRILLNEGKVYDEKRFIAEHGKKVWAFLLNEANGSTFCVYDDPCTKPPEMLPVESINMVIVQVCNRSPFPHIDSRFSIIGDV